MTINWVNFIDDGSIFTFNCFVYPQRYIASLDRDTRNIWRARHFDMQAKGTVEWYTINIVGGARFWCWILAKRGISPSKLYSNSNLINIRSHLSLPRPQVFNDATKFIKLCEQLDVVPDIWSLYEWSVWLTPTWKRTKRFETVFYLVGVDEQPHINVENDEVQNSWVNIIEHKSNLRGF